MASNLEYELDAEDDLERDHHRETYLSAVGKVPTGLRGGGRNHIFQKVAITVDGFGFFGQVSDRPHCSAGMWSMIVFEPLVLIL